MNPVAHAALQNPALSALIKLEVSNYLLRIQLGEDSQDGIEDRLNIALSDNSLLVQQLAEKDASSPRREQIRRKSLEAPSSVKTFPDVGDLRRQRGASFCQSNSTSTLETVPKVSAGSKSHRIVSSRMSGEACGSTQTSDFPAPPPSHVKEDDLNFFEMCEIGAHESLFAGVMTHSSLHAAQVSNVYRYRDFNGHESPYKGPSETFIKDIESFCFPNGVPVDIYAATAADLVSGASYDNYHVIRCTDEEGKVTYGCCITIIEKCKPVNALVEKNLVQLHGMRLASNTIKRCIRRYIAQKEHMRWSRTQANASIKSSVKSESGRSSDGRSTPPQSGSFFRKMFSRRSTISGTEETTRRIVDNARSGTTGANSLPTVAEQETDCAAAAIGLNNNGNGSGSPAVAKRRYSYFGYSTPQTSTPLTQKGSPSVASDTSPLNRLSPTAAMGLGELNTNTLFKNGQNGAVEKEAAVSAVTRESDSTAELSPAASVGATLEEDNIIVPRFRKAVSICDLDSHAAEGLSHSATGPFDVFVEPGQGLINSLLDGDEDETETAEPVPRMRKSISICEPGNASDPAVDEATAVRAENIAQDFSPPTEAVPKQGVNVLLTNRPSTARSDVFHGDSDDDDDNEIFRFSDSENERDSACERDSSVSIVTSSVDPSPTPLTSSKPMKGAGLGKVIVTKKAYCILSKKPLHSFLFKILQKIVDTERLVYEDNEVWLQEVTSDIKTYDSATQPNGTLLETVRNARFVERNKWLHYLQNVTLPSSLLCIPSPLASSYLTDTELNTHAHGMRRIFDDNYNVMNLKNHGPSKLLTTKHSSLWRYRPDRGDTMEKGAVADGSHAGLSVNTDLDPAVTSEDSYVNVLQVDCHHYNALSPKMEISSDMSSFKEWSCSILFAVMSPTLVFKIMNLLLLEKSLVICGSDMGLVSAITSAAAEIITPFEWEGIFVPLMPYVAKDVLQAPVPYIVGTTTMPKFDDLSVNAAILYLDYKLGSRDVSCEECAWFVRIPEIDANMPVSDSLQKLVKVTQIRMSKYLPESASRQNILELAESGKLYGGLGQANMFNTVTSPKGVRVKRTKSITIAADGGSVSIDLDESQLQDNKLHAMFGNVDAPHHHAPSQLLKTFLQDVGTEDKEAVARLMDAVTKHNIAFCGDAVQPGGWIQYCKYNKGTSCDEFNPQWFMQPRKAHTEFQEALVQTQMFVSHLDRLRIIYEKNSWQREFLSLWIYFKFHWRRKLCAVKDE